MKTAAQKMAPYLGCHSVIKYYTKCPSTLVTEGSVSMVQNYIPHKLRLMKVTMICPRNAVTRRPLALFV